MSNTTKMFDVNIEVEFGKLTVLMDWCKSNCNNEWYITDDLGTNSYLTRVDGINIYRFQFKDECDVIAFSLKFK